jgi:hypothetical protein
MELSENLNGGTGGKRRTWSRARLGWRLALGITAAAAATSVLLPLRAPVAHADAVFDQTITRSEVIARAQYWYHERADIPYSMSGSYADPQGDRYRTDCSGYVSMAWHLDPSDAPDTAGLATSTYTTEISSSPSSSTDLEAGDILDYPRPNSTTAGHTILFSKWGNSSHTSFWGYAFGATPIKYGSYSFTQSTWDSHSPSLYNAYRYKHIIDDDAGIATSGAAYTAGNCSASTSYPVSGVSDLAIKEKTCDERIDEGGHAILYVSEDISWTGGGSDKLDGYTLHVQAQKGNVTQAEHYCSGIESLINANSSGSESCSFDIIDPPAGSWTADGWLHAEPHNGDWLGPQYVGGAASISF